MPTENRSSKNEQMVSVPRPGREHWDKLCALPRYMFLLRPSGSGVQKLEDSTGNWIDVHEAQKVMEAAMDEIAELRDLLNQPPDEGHSAGDMADQGAKAFRDGQRALVLPERMGDSTRGNGWNACIDEVRRLNAAAITPE